jgi:hypothetical protein
LRIEKPNLSIVGRYILSGTNQAMALMPAVNNTAFDFFEEFVKENEEIMIRMGEKVVDAMWWKENVEFEEAYSICAASNRKGCIFLLELKIFI